MVAIPVLIVGRCCGEFAQNLSPPLTKKKKKQLGSLISLSFYPSNPITNWYNTSQNFLKKCCTQPHKKANTSQEIYLTQVTIFRLLKAEMEQCDFLLSYKLNKLRYLNIKNHH